MRAELLGAAGLTELVRCACGARLYLPRRQWARRGFTICDGCKAIIRYGSLLVVAADEAEEFIAMVIREGEERAALRGEVERELRRFVRVYDGQPEWLWSPATVRFVRAVRPHLERLGGPVRSALATVEEGAMREAAYQGAEGKERLDEEWLDGESEPHAD